MAGWYTNEEGVKNQSDLGSLLTAYRTSKRGAYDWIKNPEGAKEAYATDALARRIKELSGADIGSGASDDEVRLSFQGLEEQRKREALGQQQQKQILGFAGEQEGRVKDFRGTLAQSLSDTGNQFFQRLNPFILEDLNSRGLFSSETARNQEQTEALADISRENQGSLRSFDTDMFNQINDIRGTALSAQLGGDQSALDAALGMRKAGMQRSFDIADQERERAFADMMAKRKNRNQLTASLLGLGGQLGAGYLSRPLGSAGGRSGGSPLSAYDYMDIG